MERNAPQTRFLREAFRHPLLVGALAPTSARLATQVVEASGVSGASSIVELGAGSGEITRQILARKSPAARLLTLEHHTALAGMLRSRFPDLDVACTCASQLSAEAAQRDISAVDSVISTLPWTNFTPDLQQRILVGIASVLRPQEGIFTSIVCLGLHATPRGRCFRETLAAMFHELEVSSVCWRNLPPAFFYRAKGLRSEHFTASSIREIPDVRTTKAIGIPLNALRPNTRSL